MPLATPIEKALVNHDGLLGELLKFTTDYITGIDDNMGELINTYSLDPDFIHKEFVEASRWCSQLGL